MLTDDELSTIVNNSPYDLVFRVCYLDDFDSLLAQAREANKLRAEVSELTDRLAEFETVAPRGYEAEELRSGIEKLMADGPGGDIESNAEWRAELIKLLDRVDARDSLAVLVERDKLRAELDSLQAVADPDHETPELSLRDRIMHVGEQAALLVSSNRLAGKYRIERDEARAELANAQRMLTLFSNQMAEMHKVVEAARHWAHTSPGDDTTQVDDLLTDAVAAYLIWFATHPHATFAGAFTVNADGKVKP